jgi:hypothetical protein
VPEAWLATISRARSSVRFVLLCSSRGCGRFLYKTPPERRELPLDPVDPLLSALGRGIGDPCGLSETGGGVGPILAIVRRSGTFRQEPGRSSPPRLAPLQLDRWDRW